VQWDKLFFGPVITVIAGVILTVLTTYDSCGKLLRIMAFTHLDMAFLWGAD
jgi:hypothetical protein